MKRSRSRLRILFLWILKKVERKQQAVRRDQEHNLMKRALKDKRLEKLQTGRFTLKTEEDDLVKLWDLVKKRFSTTEPIDDKKKELWVELKRLFELDNDGGFMIHVVFTMYLQ
ncbi:hypothetical protein Tco_0045144 [Tanacetum coccineum]